MKRIHTTLNTGFTLTVLALSLSSVTLFAAETTATVAPTAMQSGISKASEDKSVRIQDDFFQHVNGTWLKNETIPADKSMWGSFVQLDEDVQPQLQSLIDSLVKNSSSATDADAQKIIDLYTSYLDTATIDALALKPLEGLFAQVDALTDKSQLPALIARFNRLGINAPYSFGIGQDAKNSTEYIASMGQSGLSLPDRDYYLLDEDAKLKSTRDAYVKHVEKMLTLAGDKNAAESAQVILKLETALAQVQWTKVELRDPIKTYNKLELSKLAALTPGYDFAAYFKAYGVDGKISVVNAGQPSFFTGFAKVVQEQPLDAWKTYFKWQVLNGYASYLPKAFDDENFAFNGTILQGTPEHKARWKRAIDEVNGDLGEALGRYYAAKYFPPEHKARMEKLVSNLLVAYKHSIEKLDWMTPATKKQAQLKLSTMVTKIAYPAKWRDYSALTIKKDDLIGNAMRANEYSTDYDINRLGHPVDREEWGMTPQTVNAQYNPQMNDITFPAAILRPPFFNPDADDAVNYGGIGAVIGHEISHAFDDEGSQFDEKGNLRDWWTKQDHKKFAVKTAALVKQYNAFSPLKGYNVNGELTLGENIADNSGLAIAMKAYRMTLNGKPSPVIDGYTGEQRFYIGFAQVWQMKARDEITLVLLKTDPHSPAEFRANGTVRNQPDFYKAFDVKPSDKMFLAPKDRVIIW
ncbi:M13 family metallopeptidase [Sapientia aquatica]|nr:M13-type metalloendopeptidase [Sapientia aquatica]